MFQDYDSPWKEGLAKYLPRFFEFFFPAIFEDVECSPRMRWRRLIELGILVGVLSVAASYLPRKDGIPKVSPRGEFRWSETCSDDTYYFQLRSGGSWIGLLCSNSGPMPGNFVSRGRLKMEESDEFLSGLEANGIFVLPDRGDGMPISLLFERGEETRRVALSEEDIRRGVAEVLATGLPGRERESLLARKRGGEVPDYGFALLPADWPHSYQNKRLLYWEDNELHERTPSYAELSEKKNLVLFFQNITTNGGHRTDLSVYRAEDGELYYEASTPELRSRLEVRGEVSPSDYEEFQAAIENLDELSIETSFGHDCTYYAIYQRGGEYPHRYYQWYGCGPLSFDSDSEWEMLEMVLRSALYQKALKELDRLDKAPQSKNS